MKRLEAAAVTVGIHKDEGVHDNAEMTMARLGAIHEYGAKVDHPGGTRYVVSKGKARFVNNSFTGPVSGITKAHTIIIPERSFLRSTMASRRKSYQQSMRAMIKKAMAGEYDIKKGMGRLGRRVEGEVKMTIRDMKSPPNAASTKRQKKGVDNPLIDTGQMLNSIRWKYEDMQ
jgi:hypothetical protein